MRLVKFLFMLFSYNQQFGASGSIDIDKNYRNELEQLFCNPNKQLPFHKFPPMSWCVPSDYNNGIQPWQYGNKGNLSLPWMYDMTFSILDIHKISDEDLTVTFSMYFHISWLEPRLKINHDHPKWKASQNSTWLPPSNLKYLWHPDLEIYGMETFSLLRATKDMSYVTIYRDKRIEYSFRAKVGYSCQMNFDAFPLDSHQCPFRVSSYYSSNETVNCTSKFYFDTSKQRILQYSLDVLSLPNHLRTYPYFGKGYNTCGFNVILHRRKLLIFFQVYLTSTLLVIGSWASFLIRPSIVPSRMGLLVSLFLVFINIFNGIIDSAPKSKNLNAIDTFLVICFTQVVMAMIEYIIVLYFEGTKKKVSAVDFSTSSKLVVDSWQIIVGGVEKMEKFDVNKQICKNSFQMLDVVSLFMFPSLFVVSVLFYCKHFYLI